MTEMLSQATVRQGKVEGGFDNSVHHFLGLPYAAPPIEERRWRAPEPPSNWAGIRSATRFGPACLQTVGAVFNLRAEQDEDCLYLNIWTSSLVREAKQPVMVWIHGGGFLGGAGSEDATDGARLASQGATVVAINYRLGAFGFLAHPDFGCNFGLLDQIAALEWVRDNIEAFGGDPQCVTIFGQSAGAVAIRRLLSSPHAKGLCHRAILQSGGGERAVFSAPWTFERTGKVSEELLEQIGGGDPDALRKVSAELVKRASHDLPGVFPRTGQVHTPANLVWVPVPDNVLLFEDDPLGAMCEVPILMGTTRNEARFFLKPAHYSQEILKGMSEMIAGRWAEDVLACFEGSGTDIYDHIDRVFTCGLFAEPALATLKRVAERHPALYIYRFDRVSPGLEASGEKAKHAAEIPYIFGTLEEMGGYDAEDIKLSRQIQQAWISFARTGRPDSGDDLWPRCTSAYSPGRLLDVDPGLFRIDDDPIVEILQRRRHAPA